MSAAVRSHEAHTSIRSRAARVKNPPPGPAKRRQVDGNDRANVKAVLAAPWVVQWGQAQGEKLLRLVEEGCVGVAEYHKERERRKRAKTKANAQTAPPSSTPPVLSSITFGLNETIKRLERARLDLEISVDALIAGYEDFPFRGQHGPGSLIATAPEERKTSGPSRLGFPPEASPRIVFVCVDDVNPRELVEHVPRYVSSWNALLSASKARLKEWAFEKDSEARMAKVDRLIGGREMYLVSLRKGSEQVLAHAVALRRVSVMGITNEFPSLQSIIAYLSSVNITPPVPPFPLHATSSTLATPIYAPTLLKAVHSTTPADPKSRKAQRIAAVRVARERQKQLRKKQVEKTRRTLGWKVGDKWAGGTEQKKRDKAARLQKRCRVKALVDEKKRKKSIKKKAAERRKQVTLQGKEPV